MFVEDHPLLRAFPLPRERMTIGRSACAITLMDPAASRCHAAVQLVERTPVIEDLGSRNGTWVNGERLIGRRALCPGDAVRLGNTRWRLLRSTEVTAC